MFRAIADTYRVIQVKLIFSPPTASTTDTPSIFIYGQFFRFSPSHREVFNGTDIFTPAPNINMFVLNRHSRANGTRMGDIVCLTDVREIVQLVPRFGSQMNLNLNCDNSLEFTDSFFLNHFADKETFHAILSYQ
jgi:hypothetical protein